jgi:hypothetical protein
MKKLTHLTIILFSGFVLTSANKSQKKEQVSNCSQEAKIVTLSLVDGLGLNLDNPEELSIALIMYRKYYTDCYLSRS